MVEVELTSIKADKVVDARGTVCPGPLIEAKRAIGSVEVGQVMEVWSTDSGSKRDIPIWAKKLGHEFLGVIAEAGYDRIFVLKKR